MTTREELRKKGTAIREKLGFVGTSNIGTLAPGIEQLTEEMVFGSVWARPHLALEDRMLAVLSALMSQQRLPQLGHLGDEQGQGGERVGRDGLVVHRVGSFAGGSGRAE